MRSISSGVPSAGDLTGSLEVKAAGAARRATCAVTAAPPPSVYARLNTTEQHGMQCKKECGHLEVKLVSPRA